MKKELKQTKQKTAKLLDKKALIDKQLKPLFIREEDELLSYEEADDGYISESEKTEEADEKLDDDELL